jgi:hypothetical protein
MGMSCALFLAVGCAGTGPLDDPYPTPPADGGASPPVPDASTIDVRDASPPVDASPPEDAGPPPTEGCFAEELTIATHTFDPAGRPHLTPIAIVGRDDGWVSGHEPLRTPVYLHSRASRHRTALERAAVDAIVAECQRVLAPVR